MRGRLFRSLILAGVLLLVPAAMADERVLVVPGWGVHVESDQERCYVVPGWGVYCETLTAAAPAARRFWVVGP